MNHEFIARLRCAGFRIFTALAWGFCILFYTSVFLKKKTLWIALVFMLALGFVFRRISQKAARFMAIIGGMGLAVAGVAMLLVTVWGGQYETVQGSYLESVYAAPDKVMVIVAHEDDDLNLAAGVIDSYREMGTQVKVVFFSNGDYRFKNAYRQKEALRSQKALGVPKEDVIFLGYGDQYCTEYGHLYNAPDYDMVTSHGGHTSTYGLKSHPEYRKCISGISADYTRANAVADMKELLNRERPEVIYCVDQDSNPDHRATSLFFEEAMGELLGEGTDYHPEVYKGFAYSTAWSAREDYYGENVPSTVLRYKDGRMDEANCYLWEERLRLPVRAEDLAYTVRDSALWPAFGAYGSQKAIPHMVKVINSDKVYWRRRTDSVLYTASFSADNGGRTKVLNDFKLVDSSDVEEKSHRPYDGVWTAGAGDVLTVKLEKPRLVGEIVLHDNPSMEDNIRGALITLDNGESMLTGPLEPGGADTRVELSKASWISGFTLKILETEGDKAGLGEIEAYEGEGETPEFIKLTDEAGNFLYNYTPAQEGDICLKVYGSDSKLQALTKDPAKHMAVTVDDVETQLRSGDEGTLLLPCSRKKITVRAQLISDPTVYDEIVVKPYSSLRAFLLPWVKPLDSVVCGFETYVRYYMAHGENLLLKLFGGI